jgi:hypothetical protein
LLFTSDLMLKERWSFTLSCMFIFIHCFSSC